MATLNVYMLDKLLKAVSNPGGAGRVVSGISVRKAAAYVL